jgi:hypothetical protein
MPIPQWLQANPYRVLRLSANASSGDAHKSASAMRKLALLGMENASEVDIPSLGEIRRSESDIRSAIGRLENPSHRIADRLFWLHSATERPEVDASGDFREPLKKAAWDHDQALGGLFRLYSSTSLADDPSAWSNALGKWYDCVTSDDYWKLGLVLEQLGTFEPSASADEIRALRGNAMLMASEPLLIIARQAVADDDRKELEAAIRILRDLVSTGNWTVAARKDIMAPVVSTVLDRCRENRDSFGKRIVRKAAAVAENRPWCDDSLRHFRTEIEPSLGRLHGIAARGNEDESQAREEVASCLSDIAIDFTWADRYIESEELFKEALSLAEGTLVAVQIERSLAENKSSADHQRLYEGLSSTASEALNEARRVGLSVLAEGRNEILREQDKAEHNRPLCQAMLARFRSEVQPAMQTALAAMPADHPAAKELRAETALRLNSIATDFTWADEYGFSLQLRQEALSIAVNTDAVDSISQGIAQVSESARQERMFRELIPIKNTPALSTLNGIGGKLYGSSEHDASTGSFATTYYFTFLYFPIIPLRRYRVTQEGNSYRFLGRLPLRKFDKWHFGIASSLILIAILYGMATSNAGTPSQQQSAYQPSAVSTTSEASSSNPTRSGLKAQIDAGRTRIGTLKQELEPVANEMETLKSQIQDLDSQIKTLDDQKSSGESIDIDDYNSKVNRYNGLISRRKSLYTEHQASFDEYQELLKKDDELIAQYNALSR